MAGMNTGLRCLESPDAARLGLGLETPSDNTTLPDSDCPTLHDDDFEDDLHDLQNETLDEDMPIAFDDYTQALAPEAAATREFLAKQDRSQVVWKEVTWPLRRTRQSNYLRLKARAPRNVDYRVLKLRHDDLCKKQQIKADKAEQRIKDALAKWTATLPWIREAKSTSAAIEFSMRLAKTMPCFGEDV